MLFRSLPAAVAGSVLARRFSPGWLRVALAVVLLASAAKTLAA